MPTKTILVTVCALFIGCNNFNSAELQDRGDREPPTTQGTSGQSEQPDDMAEQKARVPTPRVALKPTTHPDVGRSSTSAPIVPETMFTESSKRKETATTREEPKEPIESGNSDETDNNGLANNRPALSEDDVTRFHSSKKKFGQTVDDVFKELGTKSTD